MSRRYSHVPVLADEVVDLFLPLQGGVVVDGTLGGGGHALLLLERLGSGTSVLGVDRDPAALAAAGERLAPFGERARLVRGDFRDIETIVRQEGREEVQGVLLDLGVSSPQLDHAERGFSYSRPARLDMRMNTDAPRTAADIVNTYDESALRRVIADYGEERFATRVARAIVRRRESQPFTDTTDLAAVVTEAIPAATRRHGPHPARRTFQALRIEVNDELGALGEGLEGAARVLAPGGRLAVISYHSLEDRVVKHFMRERSAGAIHPRGLPITDDVNVEGELRLLTRKPIRPSAAEVELNPRADSARLRAAEKREVAA